MVEVLVGKQITVTGLSKNFASTIKKSLTLPNPTYYKMNKPGKKRIWMKKEFVYFKEKEGVLLIPRGSKERLFTFLDNIKEKYTVEYSVTDKEVQDKNIISTVVLRDYQVPLVDSVLNHCEKHKEGTVEGIVHAGTGTGKTLIGTELIHKLGKTATIVVPNTVLLNQFIKTLKDNYGIIAGQLGDGKKIVKDITVATVQSLKPNDPHTVQLVAQTSVLVWDEVQNCVGDVWGEVAKMFRAKIMLGLTATPKRTKNDGKTKAIQFLFGAILVVHEGTQLEPTVQVIRTGVDIPVDEYPVMVDNMVENASRNELIAKIAQLEAFSGRKILILTKRIQHYKNIFDCFSEDFQNSGVVIQIDSKDKKRNELIASLQKGDKEFSIILGTTSLLAVGTDIPSFDTLMLTCDMRSDVLVVQSAGRILRLLKGKQEPLIYDFADNKNPILMNQFYDRKRTYERKGWKVIG